MVLSAVSGPEVEHLMLGARRALGAGGLERWGEACVGAGRPQGSGSGGKCDEGAGGL